MSAQGDARRTRMQSLVDGVLHLGPQTVHIDVTNACNTDCVTCWDHSPHLAVARPAAWKRQRVDVERTRALLDDIESLGGLEAVIVSGMGEPFTHPDIYALLEDVKRRGLHCTVITNLVAADVERVIAIGVDALLVGVQGASLESYLAFHPSFDAHHWARLQSGIARLAHSAVDAKHVQVICRHNAHELSDMIDLAAIARAPQVSFKLASLRDGTEAVRISEDQRGALLAPRSGIAVAIERARRHGVQTNLDVFRAQVLAGGELTAPIDQIGCFLGTSYARVTVDGTVLYCCNTDVVVGRLGDASFSELWRGATWAALRERMRDGRFFESCFTCGKLNQNEKLSRRFREQFGDDLWRRHLGHGAPRSAPDPARAPGVFARAAAPRGRALRVLP